MIKIITKIVVKGKSPRQIFDWLCNLNQEKYLQWQPADHKNFRLIKKTKNLIGTIIYFDEIFDGFRVSCEWEFIKVSINLPSSFEGKMKAKTFYPVYLHLLAKKIDDDTQIIHELNLGFSFKGLEKIFDWFVKKFIFTEKKIRALKRHVIEEFKNLENIV